MVLEQVLEFFLEILNYPITYLLDVVKILLIEPVIINIFKSLWSIIVYLISFFYIFGILFSAFKLMTSSMDSAKRENAKTWLKNTLLAIVFVQASYIIYSITIDFSSGISKGLLEIVSPEFFTLTIDNISNFGLQIIFYFLYLIVLLLVVLILFFRYLMVSLGVIIFPIGLLFYFIPPLKEWGSMIIKILMTMIFINFFQVLALVGFDKFLEISLFENFKILLTITAFITIFVIQLIGFVFAFYTAKKPFEIITQPIIKTVRTAAKLV